MVNSILVTLGTKFLVSIKKTKAQATWEASHGINVSGKFEVKKDSLFPL